MQQLEGGIGDWGLRMGHGMIMREGEEWEEWVEGVEWEEGVE